jgi:hypothetical protein
MKNRDRSRRKAHGAIEGIRAGQSDDFDERFTRRRCKGLLASQAWREIGTDTVTGEQVRVCGRCWLELTRPDC